MIKNFSHENPEVNKFYYLLKEKNPLFKGENIVSMNIFIHKIFSKLFETREDAFKYFFINFSYKYLFFPDPYYFLEIFKQILILSKYINGLANLELLLRLKIKTKF